MFSNIEEQFIKSLQQFDNKIISSIMILLSFLFHMYIFPIIMGILYYYEIINLNKIIFFISCHLILLIIKYTVKRNRPYQNNKDIMNIEPMFIDEYSFPSGHTVNAIILANIIIDKSLFYSNIINLLPLCVGISRCYLGVHYPTDIIGAYIFTNLMICYQNPFQS